MINNNNNITLIYKLLKQNKLKITYKLFLLGGLAQLVTNYLLIKY